MATYRKKETFDAVQQTVEGRLNVAMRNNTMIPMDYKAGDWIVTGPDGQIYPISDVQFTAQFEEV